MEGESKETNHSEGLGLSSNNNTLDPDPFMDSFSPEAASTNNNDQHHQSIRGVPDDNDGEVHQLHHQNDGTGNANGNMNGKGAGMDMGASMGIADNGVGGNNNNYSDMNMNSNTQPQPQSLIEMDDIPIGFITDGDENLNIEDIGIGMSMSMDTDSQTNADTHADRHGNENFPPPTSAEVSTTNTGQGQYDPLLSQNMNMNNNGLQNNNIGMNNGRNIMNQMNMDMGMNMTINADFHDDTPSTKKDDVNDIGLQDAFPDMSPAIRTRKRKKKKDKNVFLPSTSTSASTNNTSASTPPLLSKKRKRKHIPIVFNSFTPGTFNRTNRRQQQQGTTTSTTTVRNSYDDGIAPFRSTLPGEDNEYLHLDDLDIIDTGMEDFYSETHETQDPANKELTLKKEGKRREEELIELANKKKETHATILKELGAMWELQLQNFEQRCEELHEKMNTRQLKQRDELADQYNATIKALKEKGQEEMRNLNEKNQTYLNEIENRYRQWMNPQRQLPPQMQQMRMMDLQQNKSKVNELTHNLSNKVKELLAETEADHQKKRRKLQRHHQHRKDELKGGLKYMRSKLQQRHYQFKILRIREHEEKFQTMQKKVRERNLAFQTEVENTPKKITLVCGSENNEKGQNPKKQKGIDDAPSEEGAKNYTDYEVGAAMRHKRRKAFLTRSFIPSLMIEIHNEGLNVSCRTGEKNDEQVSSTEAALESKEKSKVSCDFIPWGYAARRFLHSIICGEIPDHDITDNKLICNLGLQGQIKCLVLDLRVSAEEALLQREVARKSANLQELSKHAAELKISLSNDIQAETMCTEKLKRSEREWEKAKAKLQSIHTPSAQMEERASNLAQILKQYRDNVMKAEILVGRNKEKLKLTRDKRITTTDAYKKILRDCDHAKKFQAREDASKEYETDDLASYLFTLHKVTNERKKSSLSQKEKVQTKPVMVVLREPKLIAREARVAMTEFASENSASNGGGSKNGDGCSIEDAIRAEQLLLLSLHPAVEKKLSALPPSDPNSNMEWAEPGWHLNLDVPCKRRHTLSHNSALQLAPHSYHFNCLYSEFSSSQGHQTASILDTHHLKVLANEGNLSKSDNSFVLKNYNAMGTDPLCREEEEITISYEFVPPFVSKPKANSSRKRSRKSNTDGKGKKRRSKDDGS